MSEHKKAIVVGGGIVGCSVLYGLTRLGWSDCLLLEKRNLTSGSTWHAAGNVTYFGHYESITRLYVNSIKNYLAAEAESGQPISFHPAGSLRLATTPNELAAYNRLKGLYKELGIEYEVITPKEITEIHPLVNTANLHGAAYTPTDGHVDASGTTHALAKAARLRGAQIKTHTEAETIRQRPDGHWSVTSGDQTFIAEHLVIATSFWGRELMHQIGLNLPLFALEHHELITEDVPELIALDFEVPTVRDPFAPSNTRQEGDGFLCGVYESKPKAWATDGIPVDFKEELLVPNIERLEPHLLRVIERIPAFGAAGIKQVNNGPICYTPDGCPLLGPVENHPGLWLASGFCVGIGTGGGSGEFLAHWMVEGHQPYDLPIVHPSRFSNDMSRQSAIDAMLKTYAQGYPNPQ